MLKIEIREALFSERQQDYVKDGQKKTATFKDQIGWAFVTLPSGNPAPYPEKVSIGLDKDQGPFPVGFYTLALESLYVGRFDKLQVGKIKLKPLTVAAQKAA